jgi:quercetin dioxygenase-like cupin family protein
MEGARKMIEQKYGYTLSDTKVIERIVSDDNVDINHMILRKSEALTEHDSNSHVYMIVVRGSVTLRLNDQEPHTYTSGSIINIPFQTKMNVSNSFEDVLEFFVVKAPSPKDMAAQA